MVSLSSLLSPSTGSRLTGTDAHASRQLAGANTSAAQSGTSEAAEDTRDPVTAALEDAEALGEQLASQWEQAKAKAEIVYQLITGGKIEGEETQDLITNMLLTAYDELYTAEDQNAVLEDMPSYALALTQWGHEHKTTSTYSLLA
ncbi:hypothetical protein [Roseibium aestuarii]|uniref:Uncharacterized protein n=1 Tax=Roseibium aestuarii TaxID=2600299 RepID=A0ABW4JSU2_9HYPH|nr:hypothetical protein [Roseibium aestuarii]